MPCRRPKLATLATRAQLLNEKLATADSAGSTDTCTAYWANSDKNQQTVAVGRGRIVASHNRSSTSHQIR